MRQVGVYIPVSPRLYLSPHRRAWRKQGSALAGRHIIDCVARQARNGEIWLNANSVTKYQSCVYIYGRQKMWQVNREKEGGDGEKRGTFMCENEWEDGESYSGCNAAWNLLVMEKGRKFVNPDIFIFLFFSPSHWSFLAVTGATEKVLSSSQFSLWDGVWDCYSTVGVGGSERTLEKRRRKKIIKSWNRRLFLQSIDGRRAEMETGSDWMLKKIYN